MNTNMKKKEICPVDEPIVKKEIGKLEPFGNDDMYKLVAKINEIIDYVNK